MFEGDRGQPAGAAQREGQPGTAGGASSAQDASTKQNMKRPAASNASPSANKLPRGRELEQHLAIAGLSDADQAAARLRDLFVPSAPLPPALCVWEAPTWSAPGLLVGWLRPLEADRICALCAPASRHKWHHADLGLLTLCDGGSGGALLPCCCRVGAVRPEHLDALVATLDWRFVPETVDAPAHLELGRLAFCSPSAAEAAQMRLPPTLAVHELCERVRAHRKTGTSVLYNLRGELLALSEPYGHKEPIFLAEFGSVHQRALRLGRARGLGGF